MPTDFKNLVILIPFIKSQDFLDVDNNEFIDLITNQNIDLLNQIYFTMNLLISKRNNYKHMFTSDLDLSYKYEKLIPQIIKIIDYNNLQDTIKTNNNILIKKNKI